MGKPPPLCRWERERERERKIPAIPPGGWSVRYKKHMHTQRERLVSFLQLGFGKERASEKERDQNSFAALGIWAIRLFVTTHTHTNTSRHTEATGARLERHEPGSPGVQLYITCRPGNEPLQEELGRRREEGGREGRGGAGGGLVCVFMTVFTNLEMAQNWRQQSSETKL